jgi:hypothetical protein
MQAQEAKSTVKNFVRQRCAEGFNSGVKGLNLGHLLAEEGNATDPIEGARL